MSAASGTVAVARRLPVPAATGRIAVELLPPFVVALLILPFVIAHGRLSPWQPSTIDLQVYVYAVKDMLAGRDIYQTTTPFWNLYFIYPPIAAVLMWFLAFGPYVLWQVLWTLGLVWAQQSVLRRCGVPRGWLLGLLGIAVVLAVEPIRTTLGYGQVNTLLMALVVADLLPDPPGERRRRIPQGTLIGLAAAIKLTPALFVVFLFLLGRHRAALTGIASFAAFTLVGTLFQFRQTLEFWGGLSGGNTRTASPLYTGNQSLLGAFFRVVGPSTTTALAGLAVAGLVALLATAVAAWWWQRGQPVFAVGLVGLGTCLASPLSWTHHYVWILPLAVAVIVRQPGGSRRTPLPRWASAVSGAWVLWVCACPPLAVLPYGGGRERNYTLLQSVVVDLGPLLGVALVVGLGWQLVSQSRSKALAPAAAS
ncbi:MAG TPA: glycosyltransferase 87 family protein [Propionibacteriaceae bacterium]|nr:glycosyltransferase 87 family protein [Propionibacteriaceae bacterium]